LLNNLDKFYIQYSTNEYNATFKNQQGFGKMHEKYSYMVTSAKANYTKFLTYATFYQR